MSRGDRESSAAVAVALRQIRATTADVEDLVHGAGAVGLGQGRLVDAVRDMARRSPVPVEIRVEGTVAASEEVERAPVLRVRGGVGQRAPPRPGERCDRGLGEGEGMVRAMISDDGIGGADPGRPGLAGLAERMAMLGGRLRVESPPGAGTVLCAELPVVVGLVAHPLPGHKREVVVLGVGEGELVALLAPRRAVGRQHEAGVRVVHVWWAARNRSAPTEDRGLR